MPPKPFYTDPDVMQSKIDEYYIDCDDREVPYTVPGLAYWLGFASRQALWDYANRTKFESEPVRHLFNDIIKKAKLKMEAQCIEEIRSGKKPAIPGIFNLKCNHGYIETQRIELDGSLSVEQKLRDLAGTREG